MADVFRFTILGCSSSGGVPRIGNDWGVGEPNEPKNRRRRGSLLVRRIRKPDSSETEGGAAAANLAEDGAHHGHADHAAVEDDLTRAVVR